MWLYFALCIFVLLVFILIRTESLIGTVVSRINAVEERFQYDWTQMSAELQISAYRRSGGLLCRAEQRIWALATTINMPVSGDWLIFEVNTKTYRGEVVGREIRYGEADTQTSATDSMSTRLHMTVRIDVVCDDEGWPPSPADLATDDSFGCPVY